MKWVPASELKGNKHNRTFYAKKGDMIKGTGFFIESSQLFIWHELIHIPMSPPYKGLMILDETELTSDEWRKIKDDAVREIISTMFDSLSAESIKYFLKTGTVNGGFLERLNQLMDRVSNCDHC